MGPREACLLTRVQVLSGVGSMIHELDEALQRFEEQAKVVNVAPEGSVVAPALDLHERKMLR